MKQNRNEVLRKRYQVYRKLGYNSVTARVLAQRKLNVDSLEISQKTGKLKRNKKTKRFIEYDMREYKLATVVDNYTRKTRKIENDTNYTHHGLLTHDRRYKGETGKVVTIIRNENRVRNPRDESEKIVSIIEHQNRLSNDQAYYFFWYMNKHNLTYAETKEQLLSNKEFEDYDKNKKARQQANRKRR